MSFDLKIQDGDIVVGSNNDLAIVENTNKLIQDVLKLVVTPIGSNPFHPWYGSPLSRSLLGKALEPGFVSSIASQQLHACLDRLMSLQRAQLKSNQLVTASEQIAATKNIFVKRNNSDPRFYTVAMTILSKAIIESNIPVNIRI